MPPPKHTTAAVPPEILAELLSLRPYVEHILCEGSREPHVRAAAKDRVQTILRKAIQHLPSYQPHKEGLRPWLTRITRNEKVDVHRSSRRRDDTFGHDHIAADLAPGIGPSPEREVQVRALLERVFAIIEEMPPDMQDVLVLSAFCDDSHAEIAARLGISKNAAKMRLVRARQMLRKRVGCIDDHVGVGPLFWARKVAAFRLPAIRLLWSTSHLLPPILIWLVAMPQLEPTPPMLAENVVASSTEKSSLYVPDNRHAVDMGMTNSSIVRPVDPMTPRMHNAAGVHASDKPRPSTQTRRTFDVALPSVPTLMNDRR